MLKRGGGEGEVSWWGSAACRLKRLGEKPKKIPIISYVAKWRISCTLFEGMPKHEEEVLIKETVRCRN